MGAENLINISRIVQAINWLECGEEYQQFAGDLQVRVWTRYETVYIFMRWLDTRQILQKAYSILEVKQSKAIDWSYHISAMIAEMQKKKKFEGE